MQFRTELSIGHAPAPFSYSHHFLFIGSCFAQNMQQKMERLYFNTLLNPFGTLFNPISIAHVIEHAIESYSFTQNDFYNHKGRYLSMLHNTEFEAANAEELARLANETNALLSDFLKKTNVLFITFGSAHVYSFNENGKIAGNCHQLPMSMFTKHRLDIGSIVDRYKALIARLLIMNPRLKIVFTLSPVRYLSDGFVENQTSKAILHLSIQELVTIFPSCHYFPAYEIVMDDLRDYRFYAEDLIHLNPMAVDYIWEQFQNHFFSLSEIKQMREAEKIAKMFEHKPTQSKSEEYMQFIENAKQKRQKFLSELGRIEN